MTRNWSRIAWIASPRPADLCSGISWNDRQAIGPSQLTDGADFNCFMVRPATLERFGFFDPNYRPAYFEDNDYYARAILDGGICRVVHAAQFFHHGSLTPKAEKNRSYFAHKWGVSTPANDSEGVLARYYRYPFNDPTKPLSWFPT
jgi:GT2 family glycosyltransferase